ncbi:MAG: Asp-tRNA(Asn)/Glu-tRNA(Gln) amidotransferase subunit GatC [Candidatus Saganbacteria bacterium]|nr:Asp-tRNA(Asn)/Glu-tRNA(Gln) amidotransferase subunit GatC [Candidatus Saganbacteria bacterium]
MALTIKDVEHVAKLARLGLSEEEKTTLVDQLSKIFGYMEVLNKIDTKGVLPTSHALPMKNVFRQDKAIPFNNTDEILANGPEVEKRMFKVPKILD